MSSTSNVAASSTGSTSHLNRRSLQASEDRFLPQEMLFDALLQWTPTSPTEVETIDPLSDASSASDESPSSKEETAIPVEDSAGSDKDDAEGELDPSSQWNSLCCESLSVPSLAPPPQLEEQNGNLPSDEKINDQDVQSTIPVRPLIDAVERDSGQLDGNPKFEFETPAYRLTNLNAIRRLWVRCPPTYLAIRQMLSAHRPDQISTDESETEIESRA